MSLKPTVLKIQKNRRYLNVAIAFMLLGAGMFLAKLPYTDTIVQAAAKFLTSVAHNTTLTGNGTATSPLSIASGGVGTNQLADAAVTAPKIASGQVVKNINGLSDGVTLLGGSNISITLTGNNTLTIDANFPPPQQSSPQPYINPLRVATLQWYEAIETGLEFPVGPGLRHIAFDGANVWVTRGLFGSVSKIRVSDGALLGTFSVSGGEALGVAFDGANIWVACGDFSRRLVKLRASDGVNLGGVTLPVDPFSLAFDGSHIWATTGGTNTVTKVRARDAAIVASYNAGPGPQSLAFDGANMWVTNPFASTVTKIRASDGALLGTFTVASLPRSIAFDGTNIWITHSGVNMVTKLRASDGMVLGVFNVGPTPAGIVFDGANIWVANLNGNTVTKIRALDGVTLGTFATGTSPSQLAFDGANVWVTNQGTGTVSKL
jgi:hypothetical protein